jgi:hypothetical protein
MKTRWSDRYIFFLFFACLLTYGYFYNGASWNQNSRLDAIYAFSEPGHPEFRTFRIDRFIWDSVKAKNTGDWAYVNGHYYSNKAPGIILLGIPAYELILAIESILALPASFQLETFNGYLLNFLLTIIPISLGIVFFYLLLKELKYSEASSKILSLTLAFGTLAFSFSTQLWGHTTALGLLCIGLYLLFGSTTRISLILAGVLLSLASICDFVFIFIAGACVVFKLLENPRAAANIILGSLPAIIALFAYNYLTTGSYLSSPIQFSNAQFLEPATGLFAFVGRFSFSKIFELTFGLERGLFLYAPILLTSLAYFFSPTLPSYSERLRRLKFFALFVIILILILNSFFNGWHGGSSAGPRYLMGTLPFWILLIPEQLSTKLAFKVLLVISILIQTVVAAINPVIPEQIARPLQEWVFPQFLSGYMSPLQLPIRNQELNPNWASLSHLSTFNVGELLGIRGLLSLLPLIIILTALTLWQRRKLAWSGSVILVLFLLHIIYPGEIPWLSDEPKLIASAYKLNQLGEIASTGLRGSLGLVYGNFPTIVYQLLLLIFISILSIAFVKTALVLGITIYALQKISKSLNWDWQLSLFFLVSPYLFLFNRILWDNPFLIPLSAVLFWQSLEFLQLPKIRTLLVITILTYLMVQTHLLAALTLIPLLFCLMFFQRQYLQKNWEIVLLLFAFGLMCLTPYLLNTLASISAPTNIKSGNPFNSIFFIGTSFFSFNTFIKQYLPSLEFWQNSWTILSWNALLATVILVLFILGIIKLISQYHLNLRDNYKERANQNFILSCLIVVIFSALGLLIVGITPQAHYLNALWLPSLILVVFGLRTLPNQFSKAITLASLMTFLIFVCCFYSEIKSVRGSKSMFFGSSLIEQLRLAKAISEKPANSTYMLANKQYQLFPEGLETLLLTKQFPRNQTSTTPAPKYQIRYPENNCCQLILTPLASDLEIIALSPK